MTDRTLSSDECPHCGKAENSLCANIWWHQEHPVSRTLTSEDVLTRVEEAAHDLGNDPPNGITTMRALTALHDAAAEINRLRGLKPQLPPRPPDGSGLPRYGLRHNGPGETLATPMEDGYWTPWHLADRHAHETGEAPTPHHVQYDTVGWLCSVCGGWNREAFTSCSHPHPQNDGSAHG